MNESFCSNVTINRPQPSGRGLFLWRFAAAIAGLV
jgi:hypothetical protein